MEISVQPVGLGGRLANNYTDVTIHVPSTTINLWWLTKEEAVNLLETFKQACIELEDFIEKADTE